MNIILRRCLGMLNLTMWKRDYYDPAALTEIPVKIFFYNFQNFFYLSSVRLVATFLERMARLPDYYPTSRGWISSWCRDHP